MSPKRETIVSSTSPLPKGYAFLHKGNTYKTLHCRRLTREAGKHLYVVHEGKQPIGVRIPRAIYNKVQEMAKETLDSRKSATEKRDAALLGQAETEMKALYPDIPPKDAAKCLQRAFRKRSGRVGRSGQISMSRKVVLAVIAHIRHTHTDYDALLDAGGDRAEARLKVLKKIRQVAREWGGPADERALETDSDRDSTP